MADVILPLSIVDVTMSARDYLSNGHRDVRVGNNNRVMVRPSPDVPEAPMAGARVRLHRLTDGACVWRGDSDAQGWYCADGLENGVEYVPVAIDVTRTYECVASGPVVAASIGALYPLVLRVPIGVPLQRELLLSGADEPAVMTLASGSLPDGITYSADRFLSGASPTGAPGQYALTFDIASSGAVVQAVVTIDLVLLPLTLRTQPAMPASFAANAEIAPIKFVAIGGEGPYLFDISAGNLPIGLVLDGATGTLHGTPTTPGDYSFTARATDVRHATTILSSSTKVA